MAFLCFGIQSSCPFAVVVMSPQAPRVSGPFSVQRFHGFTVVKSCDLYSQYRNFSPSRRYNYAQLVGEEIAMVSASESGSDLI